MVELILKIIAIGIAVSTVVLLFAYAEEVGDYLFDEYYVGEPTDIVEHYVEDMKYLSNNGAHKPMLEKVDIWTGWTITDGFVSFVDGFKKLFSSLGDTITEAFE